MTPKNSLTIPAEEFFKILLETLNGDPEKRVAFRPGGKSMLPTLRDRKDVVYLGLCGKLKKYDIALYRSASGGYALHRVIGILPDGAYIFRGDGRFSPEPPTPQELVYAKAYAFERGKLRVDCESSLGYKLYSRAIVAVKSALWGLIKLKKKFRRATR